MKTAAITYIALIFLAFLIGSIVAYRLLRFCLKLVATLSGVPGRFVVIALGLASVFFPNVLSFTLKSFLWFGLDVGGRVPESLRTGWYQALKDCSSPATESEGTFPARCIVELGLRGLSALTKTVRDAYADSSVYRIQVDQLLYLLALWVAISLCFRQVTVSTGPTQGTLQGKPWLGLAYDRLSAVSKKNILFFVTLAVAAYLSIAAITAIPSFLDKSAPTEQITRELTSHLDDELKDQQKHLKEIGEDPAVDPKTRDPFEALRKKLSEAKTELGGGQGTINPQGRGTAQDPQVSSANARRDAVSQIEDTMSYEQNLRELTYRQWKLLLARAEPDATSDKVAALNAFQLANSGRVGIRETNQHSLSLEAWYRTRINRVNSQLSRCRDALLALDSAWQPWIQTQLRSLDSIQQTSDLYRNYYPVPDESVRRAGQECTYTEEEYDIPTRATLGSSLGPFGLVAKWLVETESLHLALITGLLGFGLLGSACSTFIREQLRGKQNEPLVRDLASVVIRGSSAAIVVFLAVEGGLGIFSGSTTEPNPYVLLFTCLVASVFSEDVWAWAEKKLKDELGKRPPQLDKQESTQEGKQGVQDEVGREQKESDQPSSVDKNIPRESADNADVQGPDS